MPISTANFPELLWPGIRSLFGITYKDYPIQYPNLFSIETSDKAFEKIQGVTAFGLASKKPQGQPINYTMPYQGLMKEYVHDTYGIGTVVTREMAEDDQYRYINQLPRLLARSMRLTEETVAWNIINRAFNSSYLGADGKSLCATDHPLVRGGTFANKAASSADLSQTSLEVALTTVRKQYDDAGMYIMANPVKLVIPTGLEITAKKILNSTQVTGSADNDVNVIKGAIDLVISPYLTDDDTWFITTDIPNGLTWFWRRRTQAQREDQNDTHVMKFASTARYTCGWTDPRCIYGVEGA